MPCNHPAEWTAQPLVSVTVLNWNGERLLRRCLESLSQDACPHVELVLIDNGSTDGSVPLVRHEFPDVSVIALPTNLGVAGGRNAAISHLRGTFVVFLDNDVVVDRGWLPPLIDLLSTHPQAGIATPKMILSELPDRLHGVGGYLKLWTGHRELGYGRPAGAYPPGRVVEPFFAFGAALATSKRLLEHLRGFDDEMFPTGVEDLDLAWRARLSGYKVFCVTDSVVYHHLSATRGVLTPESLSLQVQHLLYTMTKCLSWPNLVHTLPVYAAYAVTMSAALSLISGNPRFFGAVLRALRRFVASIPRAWRRRVVTQRLRAVPDPMALHSEGFGLLETPGELWRKLHVMMDISRRRAARLTPIGRT